MLSVIKQPDTAGVKDIVSQQLEAAGQIIAASLLPIIEPEVDIHCREKASTEELLKAAILEELDELPAGQLVMLKLMLPEQDDFYGDCIIHPNVLEGGCTVGRLHETKSQRPPAQESLHRREFFEGVGERAVGPTI